MFSAAFLLKKGCVGVMPTDTIYGVLGSALQPKVVERIYKLRRRDLAKPMIILISGMSDFPKFDVNIRKSDIHILKRLWRKGPTSIILPCPSQKFSYLHRGTKTIAFRLPKPQWLRGLLQKIGPLVAPSANPEGRPPATTIAEARKYFGNKVDFYLDGGRLSGRPSRIIVLEKGKFIIKR